jgi:hypothetical protein
MKKESRGRTDVLKFLLIWITFFDRLYGFKLWRPLKN